MSTHDVVSYRSIHVTIFALFSRRVLELRHYDVQILRWFDPPDGRLAEMATGEGKTLVATLPTYANALGPDNKSSFIVTVNILARLETWKKNGFTSPSDS
jgi:preprotein translocase subunit SecA